MQESKTMQLKRLAQERKLAQTQLDQRFDALEIQISLPRSKSVDKQQQIVHAALSLLDEEGLNELSLRKLASKVHLKAPALYWYFKNKDALVDHMAEAILAEQFATLTVRQNDEPWQDWLVMLCKRLRSAMLGHRDGARIVAGAHLYPAVTLAQLMETASESLESAGLKENDIDLIVGTVIHFTFGRVIEEQSSPSFDEIKEMDAQSVIDTYPRLGRNIQRIQAAGRIVGFGDDHFEQSLRLIVR